MDPTDLIQGLTDPIQGLTVLVVLMVPTAWEVVALRTCR